METEKYYCLCCGEEIDPKKVAKNGYARGAKFVDRTHFRKWRTQTGFYQQFSQAGLQAQRQLQEATGVRPGHVKRSAAMRGNTNGQHKAGTSLSDASREHLNEQQRARYWRNKRRTLARIEKRLAEEAMSQESRKFLEKQVEKLHKQLREHGDE